MHVVLTKSCVAGNATVHGIHAQHRAKIETAFAQLATYRIVEVWICKIPPFFEIFLHTTVGSCCNDVSSGLLKGTAGINNK